MTCGLRKEVIMRKQTRHRFVATNYNRDERHLPFLLYNFYFMRFAQRRKGKLAKTKIFLSLTSSSKNINGFIRRLPAGQKASERAILIAESYGYELKSDETYVTPFVRRQWLKKKTEESITHD